MFLFGYISSILGGIGVVGGGVLLYKQYRNRQALYLALFTMSAGGWALVNGLADFAVHAWSIVALSGLAVITFNFFASFFLCFTLVFIRQGRRVPWWQWFIALAPSAVLACFAFSSYSIRSVTVLYNQPAQIEVGPLYIIGPACVYALFAVAYCFIAAYYRRSFSRREKLQALYIVAGSVITLVGVTLFDIVLPLYGEVRFFSVGPLFTLGLIGCTSYAIFRHELADVRSVVQRGLMYTFAFGAIVTLYVALVFSVDVLFPHDLDVVVVVSSGITLVTSIILFPVLARFFRKYTDRLFFKHGYVYADAVRDMSAAVHEQLTFDDVAAAVTRGLEDVFKATSASVEWGVSRALHHPVDETLNASIEVHGSSIGVLRVGEKRSGDPYTAQDRKLVRTVLYQVTTALERALLHEQVRTHALELEVRVRERTAELAQLQEIQSQMMIDLSHGLQTPLTVLQNDLEMLADQLQDTGALKRFRRSISEFSRFVYDLLKLARLEASSPVRTEKAVDISALLRNTLEYIEVLARAQGVSVHIDITDNIHLRIDGGQFEEVVTNLLSNALKYMRHAPERVLHVILTRERDVVLLRVRDSGRGIPSADIPFIFEKFYRAGESGIEHVHGAGVGLAICKRIVDSWGGIIRVKSTLGKGSVFTVTIPVALQPKHLREEEAHDHPSGDPNDRGDRGTGQEAGERGGELGTEAYGEPTVFV